MTRRACIITVTNEAAPMLLKGLPPSIVAAGFRESFDSPTIEIRLEGPGLPPWCEVVGEGMPYVRAGFRETPHGLMFVCLKPPGGHEAAPSAFERIIEEYGRSN